MDHKINLSQIKVQILIVFFNGSNFIKEQLDSLRKQSHKNLEFLLLDNGSCVEESKKLKTIISEYKNIKFFESTENLGPFKGFEFLMKQVDADFFCFCDQDDIWQESKVEEMLEMCVRKDLLLCYSDLFVCNKDCKIIKESMFEDMNTPALNGFCSIPLTIKNPVTGCATLCSKKLIKKAIPFDHGVPHDWASGVVAASYGKIDFLKKATVRYRHHGSNHAGGINFSFKGLLTNIKRRGSLDKYLNIRIARRIALLRLALKNVQTSYLQKICLNFFIFYTERGLFFRLILCPLYFLMHLKFSFSIGIKNIIIDTILSLVPRSHRGFIKEDLQWK